MTTMTTTDFPTRREDRALLRLVGAFVAVGALTFAMVAILTVTSGAAGRHELAAAGTSASIAIDHAVGRSGTVLAHRIVY